MTLFPAKTIPFLCKQQDFVKGLRDVAAFHTSLLDEVKAEGEKFGEDIKHLADFTSGIKKFEPWIEKSEAKKAAGMTKPKNLSEAQNLLADATVRKRENSAHMCTQWGGGEIGGES